MASLEISSNLTVVKSALPLTGLPPNEVQTPTLSPSLTYRVDLKNDRIAGYVDDEDALKQAIILALATPRGKYEIYPDDYGMDMSELIGKPHSYARAVLPSLVEECLLQDLRIDSVEVESIESVGNEIRCRVTCNGSIEVDYSVEV